MAVGSGGRAAAGPAEPGGVVAHDLADLVVVEALEFVDVGQRVGEALGVGEVGAEEQSLDAEQVAQHHHVVLEVGRDPDVGEELLDRVALEGEGHLAVGAPHVPEEFGHPHAAILDRQDAQAREAAEDTVADECGEGVGDGAVGEGHERE